MRIVALIVAAAMLPNVALSLEPDRRACNDAYEIGQLLRRERKLHLARRTFLVCAQPGCPSAAQKDCTRWTAELEEEIPSIVLGARDHLGRDLEGARAYVDSSTIAEQLDGRAIELDPGAHVFRFELAGLAEPIIERAVLREGEKRRAITAIAPAPALELSQAPRERLVVPDVPRERSLSPAIYVPGGAGAIGVAGFIFFGLNARAERSRLEKSCSPACSDDQVAGLRRDIVVADISLAVALIGAGVATYFYFADAERE